MPEPKIEYLRITAAKREKYPGFWTTNRMWPSGQAIIVELHEAEADPEPFDFYRIGQKTKAEIMGNAEALGLISYVPATKEDFDAQMGVILGKAAATPIPQPVKPGDEPAPARGTRRKVTLNQPPQ